MQNAFWGKAKKKHFRPKRCSPSNESAFLQNKRPRRNSSEVLEQDNSSSEPESIEKLRAEVAELRCEHAVFRELAESFFNARLERLEIVRSRLGSRNRSGRIIDNGNESEVADFDVKSEHDDAASDIYNAWAQDVLVLRHMSLTQDAVHPVQAMA
jgi:hypothetical protein